MSWYWRFGLLYTFDGSPTAQEQMNMTRKYGE